MEADDERWRLDAACRGAPTAWFFPERGDKADEARALCGRCPVVAECLAYALDMRDYVAFGRWGDTSLRQRSAMRLARNQQIEHERSA